MLKKFTGFKGKMAAGELDGVPFMLLAKNSKHLAALWNFIMRTTPLDPAGIKNVILIEAATLPDNKSASISKVLPEIEVRITSEQEAQFKSEEQS